MVGMRVHAEDNTKSNQCLVEVEGVKSQADSEILPQVLYINRRKELVVYARSDISF